MDRSQVDVKVSYDKKFLYKLYILFKNILKVGVFSTIKKLIRTLIFKIKGVDFKHQELSKLNVVGENKSSGVSYVASNFDILEDLINYINKINSHRYKENININGGG